MIFQTKEHRIISHPLYSETNVNNKLQTRSTLFHISIVTTLHSFPTYTLMRKKKKKASLRCFPASPQTHLYKITNFKRNPSRIFLPYVEN